MFTFYAVIMPPAEAQIGMFVVMGLIGMGLILSIFNGKD